MMSEGDRTRNDRSPITLSMRNIGISNQYSATFTIWCIFVLFQMQIQY